MTDADMWVRSYYAHRAAGMGSHDALAAVVREALAEQRENLAQAIESWNMTSLDAKAAIAIVREYGEVPDAVLAGTCECPTRECTCETTP